MPALLYLVYFIFLDHTIAEVCHSPECMQSSEYILSKMDLKADPCQDFYQYTCGNWANATDIPEGSTSYDTFKNINAGNLAKLKNILNECDTSLNGTHSSALEKAKKFYRLCIDENQLKRKGVEQVVQFILDMFSWNVTSSHGVTWSEESWDFQTALTVNQAHGFSAFFEMRFHSSKNMFRVRPNNNNYPLKRRSRKRFLDFGAKVGELLGGDKISVMNEMTKVYDLQVQLSNKIMGTSYNTTEMNITSLYRILRSRYSVAVMNISSLQKILGCKINLTNLLMNRFGLSSFNDVKVMVEYPEFFKGISFLISKTPKSTLANYIVWNAIVDHIQYFPPQFLQAYNTLYLEKDLQNKSREDQCLDLVRRNKHLLVALGAMFEEKSSFSNDNKDKINTIVKEVQNAFQRELMISPWLDDHMRQWAVKKASDIEDNIGYVDWLRDAKQVDYIYRDLDFTRGDFLQSSLQIQRSYERQLLNLSDPMWRPPELREMLTLEPNAGYDPMTNKFYIFLGLLQRPFFTPEFPMSFNFGSIGTATGHEITHGFDNEGIFSEVNGTWSWWWKNQTSHEFFNAQMNCLLDQYSNYSVGNATYDSRRGEGQIIADNGGIQASFNAFKNWQKSQDCTTLQELPGLPFSQDQMFFIGFGQTHCEYMTPRFIEENTHEGTFRTLAGVFRSTGAVSNSEDFAKAFHCPLNSPMNPEAKCRIW